MALGGTLTREVMIPALEDASVFISRARARISNTNVYCKLVFEDVTEVRGFMGWLMEPEVAKILGEDDERGSWIERC